jgi:tRNA G18 (ribose-2'-O)-methylase SpoU
MPRVPIDNLDDPRIAVYRSLKATNETRRSDQFVVEGEKLVARLLESAFPPVSVLVTDRHEPRLATLIPADIPTYVVAHSLVHSIVGFPFHRGILASAKVRPWPPLGSIVANAGPKVMVVVCPRISNPENMGAIARIADVFGVNAILTGPSCPDPFSRRVLRVSMGSSLRVPIIASERLEADVDEAVQCHGLTLFGAVTDPAAAPFDRTPLPARLGLVLGDEDRGIEPRWLDRCAQRITIPMRHGSGSLNVAVASGILLYGLSSAHQLQKFDDAP